MSHCNASRRQFASTLLASSAALMLSHCGGGGGGREAPTSPASGSAWPEDFAALANNIATTHPDPNSITRSAEWSNTLSAIQADAPRKSDKENTVAAMRLSALMRDEHSRLNIAETFFGRTPIRFSTASDGPWVAQIAASQASWLGARLIAIDNVPLADVMARMRPFVSAATAEAFSFLATPTLHLSELLFLAGITRDAAQSAYTLRLANGSEQVLTFQSGDASAMVGIYGRPGGPEAPLWQSRADRNYFMASRPQSRSVYLRYARCAVDPAVPIDPFFDGVGSEIAALPEPRLIADLRNNPGGDSRLLTQALDRLASRFPQLLQTRIVVLINNGSFSSAINNLYDFLRLPQVVTVGESPGTAPNHTGEAREFTLPRSRLSQATSSRVFTLDASLGNRNYVPHHVVAPTADDRANGRDPVLARAEALFG